MTRSTQSGLWVSVAVELAIGADWKCIRNARGPLPVSAVQIFGFGAAWRVLAPRADIPPEALLWPLYFGSLLITLYYRSGEPGRRLGCFHELYVTTSNCGANMDE